MDTLYKELIQYIKSKFKGAGLKNGIIGVSGGLDSAVVFKLLVDALTKDHVFPVFMPYKTSNPSSREDAKRMFDFTKIEFREIEITGMVDYYFNNFFPDASANRRGNKMARERMAVLFDLSEKEKGIVVGTSNRTEILLGYGTIFGDLACGFNPIAGIYKTDIRKLAAYLKIPEIIINKKPSADLWVGQTDEDDFGFSYETADEILRLYVDEQKEPKEIQEAGYDIKIIRDIINRINSNKFKLTLPQFAEIYCK